MLFFHKRQKLDEAAHKEAEAQALNSEIVQKLDAAIEGTRKLNELLDKEGGVTRLIFLATGGDRRGKP